MAGRIYEPPAQELSGETRATPGEIAGTLLPHVKLPWCLLGSSDRSVQQRESTKVFSGKECYVWCAKVDQTKAGVWMAEFDYFYTGDPPFAALAIEVTPQSGSQLGPNGVEQYQTNLQRPQRGAHHASVEIRYPGGQLRTLKATVTMRSQMFSPVVVASQQVDKVIDWPDFQTWFRDRQIAKVSPDDNFNRAVALIDSEGEPQLNEVRSILENLIGGNPKFDAGYVELARVAMKLHGKPEGIHQAETLLLSELQIRPDNVNAKILLG